MIEGKVIKYGNNVDTDVIIPARYLNTSNPEELAAHCMEDLDPSFKDRVQPGDIIVAGSNLDAVHPGSMAIKASGISCIIAETFARIFYRNALNIGLPIMECPEAAQEIREGDRVAVDLANGTITNLTSGRTYKAASFPPFMQELIQAGGLVEYVKEKMGVNR